MVETPTSPDWLDNDDVARYRATQAANHVEFAQNYLVFDNDSRARALLAQWSKALMERRTPVNASIQEYAANEALRAFVAELHVQIAVARKGTV